MDCAIAGSRRHLNPVKVRWHFCSTQWLITTRNNSNIIQKPIIMNQIASYIASNILVLMPIVLFFIAIITVIVYVYDRIVWHLNSRVKSLRSLFHKEAIAHSSLEIDYAILQKSFKSCQSINAYLQTDCNNWKTSCSGWMEFNTEISKELEEKEKDYNRLSNSFNKMASQISKLKREKNKQLA